MIESVIAQTYPHWQLCLVEGGSNIPDRAEAIRRIAQRDERISLIELNEPADIAATTNAGIDAATGSFIGFLDHDDVLAPFALNEVAAALERKPATDLFYSDEDYLTDLGTRCLPFFKPDWSPDLFFCVNYLAHLVFVRADLLHKLGGLRPHVEGAQDFDMLLRLLDQHPNICHIPLILYHWRMAEGSTAADIGAKPHADEAGRRALADHFERRQIEVEVTSMKDQPTNYHVKFLLRGGPLTSIIVPFRDRADLVEKCASSVLRCTRYQNFELLLVSNQSTESSTFEYLAALQRGQDRRIKQLSYDLPFNYSSINNYARQHATGDVLVFLNNDVEVIDEGWLEELTAVALRREIGAVGALLLYPNGSVQHAGVVLGMTGLAGHPFRSLHPAQLTPAGRACWPRNCLAVTGACLAIEAKKFDSIGGFDERFVVGGGDVALCLRLHEAGYRNVCWSHVRLAHKESSTVGSYVNAPRSDFEQSLQIYRPYLESGDHYFNNNLSLDVESVALKR